MTHNLNCFWTRLALTLVLSVGFAPAALRAADTGTLTGRFIFDGDKPTPAALTIDKDKEICGQHELVDETLVVGPKGELANVAIFVNSKVEVDPALAAAAPKKVVLTNHNCHFEPHVLGVQVGQTLVIKNSDPVAHNTNVAGINIQFNPLIPSGGEVEQAVDAPEALLVPVSCNIHPWMKAKVLIRPNPFFAISDKDGKFTIKDLPVGELEFRAMHEGSGFLQTVNVKGEDTKWAKGRFKMTIQAGENDLGDIKCAAAQFNK